MSFFILFFSYMESVINTQLSVAALVQYRTAKNPLNLVNINTYMFLCPILSEKE